MELVLIAGALVAAYLFMRSSAPAVLASPPSPAEQNIIRSIPMMKPPVFGVATEDNIHTCTPSQSTIPLVTPSIADSTVGGVDLFAASGGMTPTAGDVLIGSFTGTDGVVQYQYRRSDGDTYTTTVKNP